MRGLLLQSVQVFVNFRLDMGVNEILHIRIKSGMKQIIFIPILKLFLKMNRKSRHLFNRQKRDYWVLYFLAPCLEMEIE